jgi:WD40 repeat protein
VVTCAYPLGRPTAFTGGEDGTVRVWDLLDRRRVDTITIGRPVWRIEVMGDDTLLVGAGSELLAFRHVNAT